MSNPFVTALSSPAANLVQTDLDWDWGALGASLVLEGAAGMNSQILKNAGIDVLECGNGSGSPSGEADANWNLTGADTLSAALFADRGFGVGNASINCAGRLVTCSTGLRVELWEHTGVSGPGSLPVLHTFVVP